MTVQVLTKEQRWKWDQTDDELFYAQPRFVHHLDEAFRCRLTKLYLDQIPENAIILDLMSSWVSHLPESISYREVIGHGLNEEELKENPRLDRWWTQNLNKCQRLPLNDESIDVTLIVAGWQYLEQPEEVATELLRVTRPGGKVIVTFSNRMFLTKAPVIWSESSEQNRLNYVARVLTAEGWQRLQTIAEQTKASGLRRFFGVQGDPFFAVVASRC
ncbi:hypothetical protein OMCYN_01123 [cyanobiont of Ornithocercus magnificus]|nr:hypothetical protein OMCYN_01123 [cyanobiont of Ornithocercus magnificus]